MDDDDDDDEENLMVYLSGCCGGGGGSFSWVATDGDVLLGIRRSSAAFIIKFGGISPNLDITDRLTLNARYVRSNISLSFFYFRLFISHDCCSLFLFLFLLYLPPSLFAFRSIL